MPIVDLVLLYALFAHMVLIFIVLNKMRVERFKLVRSKEINIDEVRANHSAWPEKVRQVQNNFANQFEFPVLFYVISLIALEYGFIDWIIVALAWLFVISRYIHAYVHCGSNRIKPRFQSFAFGLLMLLLLILYVFGKLTYLAAL